MKNSSKNLKNYYFDSFSTQLLLNYDPKCQKGISNQSQR